MLTIFRGLQDLIMWSSSLRCFFVLCCIQTTLTTPISHEADLDHSKSLFSTKRRSRFQTDLVSQRTCMAPWTPYRFCVPNTRTILHISFGLIRHSVDKEELRSLLQVARGLALEGCARHGSHEWYPRTPQTGVQNFEQLMPGLQLKIWTKPNVWIHFTWGRLYEAIEGLRLLLVQGSRNYETSFASW